MRVSTPDGFSISEGLSQSQCTDAALLYWEAFQRKLRLPLGPESRAVPFLTSCIQPAYSIAAFDPDGKMIGVAGYKTHNGAFVSCGRNELQSAYGPLGAVWRGLFLSVLERELEPGVLLMDGICVHRDHRGRGIGTALLDAIKSRARALDCTKVRLDVVDTNPRAQALYERQGFEAVRVEDIWPFHRLFGFRRSTMMHCVL